MKRIIAISVAILALGGCATPGGPGVSSYFDCGEGTMLKVTYKRGNALVQVNNGAVIALRGTPSVGGSNYEGFGYHLRVTGDTATWSGKTREAPRTCQRVAVPR